MSEDINKRPDTESILSGLKDFQRATVEHVFKRLYLDADSTRRFLVADEVGLGKTLVARGVIAKTIDTPTPATVKRQYLDWDRSMPRSGQSIDSRNVWRVTSMKPFVHQPSMRS